MKAKSTFTFLAGLAMAAFATLAPNVCEAVTIKPVSGKITASGNKSGYVLLKWNAIKGATKYGILRSTSTSLNVSNLKKMKFLKTFGKSTRQYKDTTAKLGYKYYYWYGAIVGGKLYYSPIPAYGKRKMIVKTNGYTSGSKVWMTATVNGKSLPSSGVPWSLSHGGDWKFHKSVSGSKLGYFTLTKKKGGSGWFNLKVGKTSVSNTKLTQKW